MVTCRFNPYVADYRPVTELAYVSALEAEFWEFKSLLGDYGELPLIGKGAVLKTAVAKAAWEFKSLILR